MKTGLLSHADVDMILDPEIVQRISGLIGYVESDEIMIHYTVTAQCAFRCRGCINALTAGRGDSDRSTFVPMVRNGENLERDIKGIAHLIRTGSVQIRRQGEAGKDGLLQHGPGKGAL